MNYQWTRQTITAKLATYLSNARHVLSLASPQEIVDGMGFYDGAHGICRCASIIGGVGVEQSAGIYAALSPMNTWNTNVANLFDVVRFGKLATVNTSDTNRQKALRILSGEAPLGVLRGRKVRSFYLAILNPNDNVWVPIDRHLICAAIGEKLNSARISRLLSPSFYSDLETVYLELGGPLGNRAASVVWFVQRRINGNMPLKLW